MSTAQSTRPLATSFLRSLKFLRDRRDKGGRGSIRPSIGYTRGGGANACVVHLCAASLCGAFVTPLVWNFFSLRHTCGKFNAGNGFARPQHKMRHMLDREVWPFHVSSIITRFNV